MAIEFEDHFAEGSDTLVENHTPDTTGSGWTKTKVENGPAAATVEATPDNATVTTSAGSAGVMYIGDDTMSDPDYEVEVLIVTAKTAGSDDPTCLSGRYVDDSNFYAAVKYQNNNSTDVRLYSHTTASGATELANADAGTALDGKILKLEMVGAALSVWFDGTEEIASHSNSDHAGAGQGGFGWGSSFTGAAGDDVAGGQTVDDFIITVTGSGGAANPKGPLGMPLTGPFGGPV